MSDSGNGPTNGDRAIGNGDGAVEWAVTWAPGTAIPAKMT